MPRVFVEIWFVPLEMRDEYVLPGGHQQHKGRALFCILLPLDERTYTAAQVVKRALPHESQIEIYRKHHRALYKLGEYHGLKIEPDNVDSDGNLLPGKKKGSDQHPQWSAKSWQYIIADDIWLWAMKLMRRLQRRIAVNFFVHGRTMRYCMDLETYEIFEHAAEEDPQPIDVDEACLGDIGAALHRTTPLPFHLVKVEDRYAPFVDVEDIAARGDDWEGIYNSPSVQGDGSCWTDIADAFSYANPLLYPEFDAGDFSTALTGEKVAKPHFNKWCPLEEEHTFVSIESIWTNQAMALHRATPLLYPLIEVEDRYATFVGVEVPAAHGDDWKGIYKRPSMQGDDSCWADIADARNNVTSLPFCLHGIQACTGMLGDVEAAPRGMQVVEGEAEEETKPIGEPLTHRQRWWSDLRILGTAAILLFGLLFGVFKTGTTQSTYDKWDVTQSELDLSFAEYAVLTTNTDVVYPGPTPPSFKLWASTWEADTLATVELLAVNLPPMFLGELLNTPDS